MDPHKKFYLIWKALEAEKRWSLLSWDKSFKVSEDRFGVTTAHIMQLAETRQGAHSKTAKWRMVVKAKRDARKIDKGGKNTRYTSVFIWWGIIRNGEGTNENMNTNAKRGKKQ